MKKILFYGNFGNGQEKVVDGQTSKTINFYKEANRSFKNRCIITKFNTYGFSKKPIRNYINLKKQIKKNDVVIIFPGSVRNLSVFKSAYGKSSALIFYPIVGGWIADAIIGKKSLIRFLKGFFRLYPETIGLQKKLEQLGIKNTTISPTFSLREPISFEKIKKEYFANKASNTISFVYFGRIIKDKGIYLAIDAIKELNQSSNILFTLDIYGSIGHDENKSFFYSQLDNEINYHGIMKDDDVWKLCLYDFFIFPSFYPGECIPACCVESLLYGTPIIASDWKYNSEIIINEKNGFLFDLKTNNLKQIILNIIKNKYNILTLKENAFNSGKKYSPSISIKPFIDDIEEVLKNE